MGKSNFEQIYQDASQFLGERPTVKLSSFCDHFSPKCNYAGMIIYHSYGSYRWKQRPGQGVAAGYRGRSFYVLIMCTDSWPAEALRAAGEGRVHDYLYQQYFNMAYSNKRSCCAGFAVLKGESVYSSVYLNNQSGRVKGLTWSSDGSKYMSQPEKELVAAAVSAWKSRGPGVVAKVPDSLHYRLA